MRSYLPAFDLRAASDLDRALQMLADQPARWRPFAGGTDLMVLFEAGRLPSGNYLSLWNLNELRGIEVQPGTVRLGALTTYADVLASPILRAEFPLLCRAAEGTGGVATQNRGTLGGNIANASPAADTPPALLVYDAELEVISIRGTRRVPYAAFHSGYKVMDLAGDELISHITLPRNRHRSLQTYRKVGTRKAQAISKVCLAAAADLEGATIRDVRIAYASVAPTVVRCRAVEAVLRGRALDASLASDAAAALSGDIAPIDDIRSTAGYRIHVARNLLIEFVSELGSRRDQ
jgi:CO/xanthine dehydrogenase FAD-binding subunit